MIQNILWQYKQSLIVSSLCQQSSRWLRDVLVLCIYKAFKFKIFFSVHLSFWSLAAVCLRVNKTTRVECLSEINRWTPRKHKWLLSPLWRPEKGFFLEKNCTFYLFVLKITELPVTFLSFTTNVSKILPRYCINSLLNFRFSSRFPV